MKISLRKMKRSRYMLNVTRVTIDEYEPQDVGTCAECSIVINNILMIHKLKVVKGKDGEYFVTMPHTGNMYVTKEGKKRFDDVVYPLSPFLAKKIKVAVLEKYFSYANKENVD